MSINTYDGKDISINSKEDGKANGQYEGSKF